MRVVVPPGTARARSSRSCTRTTAAASPSPCRATARRARRSPCGRRTRGRARPRGSSRPSRRAAAARRRRRGGAAPACARDDVSLLLHTSGTSGRRKLVPHRLGELVAGAACVALGWGLGPDDVALNMMPLHHVGGVVRMLLAPLLAGGALVACPLFDPHRFWRALAAAARGARRRAARDVVLRRADVHQLVPRAAPGAGARGARRRAARRGTRRARCRRRSRRSCATRSRARSCCRATA